MFNGVFGLKQEKLSFPPVRRVRDMKSENWDGLSWRYRRSTIVADVQGGLVFHFVQSAKHLSPLKLGDNESSSTWKYLPLIQVYTRDNKKHEFAMVCY